MAALGELVTPVFLTKDEAPNIGRALQSVGWARRAVIVDSGSTDDTRDIAAHFKNVVWYDRPFDSYAEQWTHAIHATGVDTPFVLALDADMSVPEALAAELSVVCRRAVSGASIGFTYAIQGVPLRASLLRPQVRLFRPSTVTAENVGHGHRFRVSGVVARLRERLIHDDRKPLERWIAAQVAYSRLEARRIGEGKSSKKFDVLRRFGIAAPVIAGVLAYVRAGGPFSRHASVRYAMERMIFEALLQYVSADEVLRQAQDTIHD